jgi:hypothetical protein
MLGTACIALTRVVLVAFELEIATTLASFAAMIRGSTAVTCTTATTSCTKFRLAALSCIYSDREKLNDKKQ